MLRQTAFLPAQKDQVEKLQKRDSELKAELLPDKYFMEHGYTAEEARLLKEYAEAKEPDKMTSIVNQFNKFYDKNVVVKSTRSVKEIETQIAQNAVADKAQLDHLVQQKLAERQGTQY